MSDADKPSNHKSTIWYEGREVSLAHYVGHAPMSDVVHTIERLSNIERASADIIRGQSADIARLRAALERYGDHERTCPFAMSRARRACTCGYSDALNGPPPDETTARQDWQAIREHELRYIESVLIEIRKQNGEGARESANDTLAWLRNRLTAASVETSDDDVCKDCGAELVSDTCDKCGALKATGCR